MIMPSICFVLHICDFFSYYVLACISFAARETFSSFIQNRWLVHVDSYGYKEGVIVIILCCYKGFLIDKFTVNCVA
jgi:hypothetical protein